MDHRKRRWEKEVRHKMMMMLEVGHRRMMMRQKEVEHMAVM